MPHEFAIEYLFGYAQSKFESCDALLSVEGQHLFTVLPSSHNPEGYCFDHSPSEIAKLRFVQTHSTSSARAFQFQDFCNDFIYCCWIRLFCGPLHPSRTKVPTLCCICRGKDSAPISSLFLWRSRCVLSSRPSFVRPIILASL